MRVYSQDEEERIRAQTLVREWTRSGVLDRAQCVRLEGELRVDVRRTNSFLRAGLALFTVLVVGASVGLVVETLALKTPAQNALVTGVAAFVCIGLAELLVGRFRLYRFGVEEMLAVGAAFLLSVSGALLPSDSRNAMCLGLLVGAAGAFWIYRRFGFVYAAAGSMVCAAAIPFQLDFSAVTQHLLAAAIFAAGFVVVRSRRLRYQDDYPGDEYSQLQAAAWAGLYAALNLQLVWGPWVRTGWAYWFTYAMTWALPLAGLRWSIREKDRALLDVSLVMSIVTLVTNKPYLGWPRHEWDPILLGVFLMTIALALRRWLSMGTDGQRNGFTPARLLSKDGAVLMLLRAASTTFQPTPPSSRPGDPGTSGFDGGRSRGGGGGAAY